MVGTTLQSERLEIRLASAKDSECVAYFLRKNRKFHQPYDVPRPDEYFTTAHWQTRLALGENGYRFLVAEHGSPQHLVGMINFSNPVRGGFQACYLGYMLSENCQRRGFMHEGLCTTIAFIFGEENFHRIMANYLPTNARSARVLEKLGFVVEGTAKKYLFVDGAWQDHVMTSLTNPNWDPSRHVEVEPSSGLGLHR